MQAVARRITAIPRRWWIATLVLAVALGAGAWWISTDDEATAAARTATAALTTMRTTVSGDGSLVARRQQELSFGSSGEVTAVKVEAGDTVTKGQVLARIDTSALEADRSAALARLEAARAALVESVAAGAESTRITADQASLSAASSALTAARAAVADATLRAPFAGTVHSVGFAVGDRVGNGSSSASPGAAATGTDTSTSGISLVSTGRYDVEFTVASSDVEQLAVGQQAEISVTGSDETVFGTVRSVARIATTDSTGAASFPVVVRVTGSPSGLNIGASASATVIVAELGDVLTVPTNAVRSDDDGSYVLLVTARGTTRRAVTTGTAYGMQTEITEGLSEGDTVELVTQQRGGRGGGQGQAPEGFSPPDGMQPPAGFNPGSGFPGGAQ